METSPLEDLLTRIVADFGWDYAAIVRGRRERGRRRCAAGARGLPGELLAAALDADAARSSGRWCAVPLDARQARPAARDRRLAIARGGNGARPGFRDPRGRRRRSARRCRSAARRTAGNNARDHRALESYARLDELLKEMAEAAARLLNAQRASIFLWDERLHELVGRPALGVPGGELRVPDNQGVVGQVLKTGQPVRVAEDDRSPAINRRVDQRLGFRTRNLVGVPLVGPGGQRFGVFEVLNRRQGDFTVEDETALLELARHAAVAIEHSRQFQQLVESRSQVVEAAAGGLRLLGECRAIQQLRTTITRVASTDLAVLVLGENGTGKEVVSRLVHYGSPRRNEPLVAVNCAALPETLLESELFGHERGAFTDAQERRPGKFELASRGTLFLDEIGDLSLGGQAKLLRVLEDKLVMRVGGSAARPTDTRVLAATNQNLVELVRARKFREDLYFRLNVVASNCRRWRARRRRVLAGRPFLGGVQRQGAARRPDVLDRRQKTAPRAPVAGKCPRTQESYGAARVPVSRRGNRRPSTGRSSIAPHEAPR